MTRRSDLDKALTNGVPVPRGEAQRQVAALVRAMTEQGRPWEQIKSDARVMAGGKLKRDEFKTALYDGRRAGRAAEQPEHDDDPLPLVRASDVRRKRTRWLWQGRIPQREVTLLAGRKGIAKSTCFDWLTAELTRGTLPGAYKGKSVSVIRAAPEDAPEETSKPRLEAAGADLDRVYFVALDRSGELSLPEDVDRLKQAVRRVDAALVVLDPITAFLSDATKANDEASVRRALMPLVMLAREINVSALASIHLNKKADHDALMRVLGSVGFVNVVRSVLFMGRDPSDPDPDRGSMRVIAHEACNVGPEQPSLAAHIEPVLLDKSGEDEATSTSRLVIDGETDVRANQLLSKGDPDEQTERDHAVTWLRAQLADGPQSSRELLERCQSEVPCSKKTLRRAKDAMSVVAEQTAEGWVWSDHSPASALRGKDGGA